MLRPTRCFDPRCAGLVLTCATMVSSVASAQDFRVATTVSLRHPSPETRDVRWKPLARSVTYFHAGKVYDYMETVAEVVIFEPTQNQFTILSLNGNNLATTLQFPQLHQYLKVARSRTEDHIESLAAENSTSESRREALAFQLSPQFDESFDPSTRTLTFISPMLRYEVVTEAVEKPLVVQQYLQYADWAAKLNYVLHSGTLFPEVRLTVNKSLRERDRVPSEVRLFLQGKEPVQLRARHKFDWSLGTLGQSTIRKCETMRTSDDTHWVEFGEYQRMLVADSVRR